MVKYEIKIAHYFLGKKLCYSLLDYAKPIHHAEIRIITGILILLVKKYNPLWTGSVNQIKDMIKLRTNSEMSMSERQIQL